MQPLKLKSLRKMQASLVFASLTLLLLIIFAGLFISQVKRNPLRLDEVEYFRSMDNIVKLGVPIYYSGEVRIDKNLLIPLSIRYLAGQEFKFFRFKPETGRLKETFIAIVEPESRYIYGMWHPPLYIYLGSLFLQLFPLGSDNSSWLRYFNLIFALGIFGGMAALARELNENKSRQLFLMALVLFVSSKLALSGSLLIDYNATLGPCVTVWIAVAYLRSEHKRRLSWALILLIILGWFTSLGIAVSLLLGLLGYWLFWGRRQVSGWYPLAAVLLGSALFLPVFLVFCRILNLPFTQPFLHNLSRAGVQWNFARLVAMGGEALEYVGLYSQAIGIVAVCIAIGFFARMFLVRGQPVSPARALLPVIFIAGMLVQASLGANAWGFMKYLLFLLPLLFVYIASEVLHSVEWARIPGKALAIAALLVVLLANSLGLYQLLKESGGTLYDAGKTGVIEVADRVRMLSDATQVILSEKDIAFYADRKFIEWFGPRFTDVDYMRTLINAKDVKWIAISSQTLESTSEAVKAYLGKRFVEDYRMGDFIVLKRNEQSGGPLKTLAPG